MTKELSLLDAYKAYNAGKPVNVTARYLFQSDTKTGHAETIEQSTVIKKGNDYRTADNSFYTPINFADHLRVAKALIHDFLFFGTGDREFYTYSVWEPTRPDSYSKADDLPF